MLNAPKDPRILLVEDAAVMRKIELKALKSLGFEDILEAKDGDEAILKLESEERIDLVISDWNMPNKGGYELLVWMRAHEKFEKLPFIMATGEGDMKQEKKAVDAGVDGFIAKPFNADELKKKIDQAFGKGEKEEELPQEKKTPRKTVSGKVRLRIAHIQITDHLVLGALKHLIKNGDLTPRHFELETLCMPGWNPVQEALGKGMVDAACILAPMAMDLFNFGIPIKMVLLAHKGGSICVRSTQGEYREPFQNFFKKKTFLIPHKMSVHHMLAHMFFSRIGIKSGMAGGEDIDLNFEVVAPVKMPEFLRGNPDACGFMVAEPLGTKSIASGIATLQFLSSQLWENHPCCVVAIRDDFSAPYTDAVYEFTEMLVKAGKFIETRPETAAEIAVSFLDPQKILGLKVPVLKNVLTEAQGIKTGDLLPSFEEIDRMQRYMVEKMGIGSLIDVEKFIDPQFAEAACKDLKVNSLSSRLHDTPAEVIEILRHAAPGREKTDKSMLSMEGKYLVFALGKQEFGINIYNVREIIGRLPIRSMPGTPPFVKGVINLRDKVIPVMELRLRFGMEEVDATERNCIIVLEQVVDGTLANVGVVVDSVTEVLEIKTSEIEDTPFFGAGIDTTYILAMAKTESGVKILLDMDRLL